MSKSVRDSAPKSGYHRYAIPTKPDGSLTEFNQRMYNSLMKVAAGEVSLNQIHTDDDQVMTAGDFSYKVIAAVNRRN
mgnify:FL=1